MDKNQMDELLTCAVCRDRFKRPKQLPCQHIFCLTPCLDGVAEGKRICCPECRADHCLPFNGVKGFPNSLIVTKLLDVAAQNDSNVGTFRQDDLINGMKELRMNYQNSKYSEFSGDAQTTFTCIKCESVIGKTSDVCKIGDFESYAVKRNPYGYTFNTVTIASIQAYEEEGEPTLWATWFDGYAWTICYCSECNAHIGWQFRNCRGPEISRVVTFFCLTLAALETSKLPSACT